MNVEAYNLDQMIGDLSGKVIFITGGKSCPGLHPAYYSSDQNSPSLTIFEAIRSIETGRPAVRSKTLRSVPFHPLRLPSPRDGPDGDVSRRASRGQSGGVVPGDVHPLSQLDRTRPGGV
jgi:hypothetical protein